MKALILNGTVVQVAEEAFEVAEPLHWLDCTEDVQPGYTLEGTTFVAPPVPPEPEPEPEPQPADDYTGRDLEYIIAHTTRRVQQRLDVFAQTRNYDGILSAATYATSTVPKFASEGQYAVVARDATWAALYAMMGAVQDGQRAMPTSYAEVEAELPALEWPV